MVKKINKIKYVQSGHWMAVTRDYKKVVSTNLDYSVLRKETADRADVVYLKLPPNNTMGYIFAN